MPRKALEIRVSDSNLGWPFFMCPNFTFLVSAMYLVTSVKICTKMIEVSSEQSRSQFILLCLNVFSWHIGIFCSSGRRSFLVLSDPWHAGSPPEHHCASVSPGRRPWHVLWGLKSHVSTGRHSEHVGPSRPVQTHVQVKRMSDGLCDIWDLECHIRSMSSDITC